MQASGAAPAAQAGAETLCKFHWLPTGGAQFMDDEEAQATGAENMRHSHATADLVRGCPKRCVHTGPACEPGWQLTQRAPYPDCHLPLPSLSDEQQLRLQVCVSKVVHLMSQVEAIQSGNPPTWGFYIQTMPVADQGNYNFDPLDATKVCMRCACS